MVRKFIYLDISVEEKESYEIQTKIANGNQHYGWWEVFGKERISSSVKAAIDVETGVCIE